MELVPVPRTSERIRGVTLPENGVMYVCDYDEVFKISVEAGLQVEILDDDPYEYLDGLPHSLGVYGHAPILESNGNVISYDFKPGERFVVVSCKINGEESEIKFRTLSGDWFSASFSKCGQYLLLAEPYDFDLYKV